MRLFIALLAMLMLAGCGVNTLEKSAYGDTVNGLVEPVDPSMTQETPDTVESVFFAAMPGIYPVGIDEITFQMYYYGSDPDHAPEYTSYWTMEVWVDDAWRVIPLAGLETRPDYLRHLGTENDQSDSPFSIELSRLDYDFGPGKYRLLKEFGGVMYAAGFTISEEYH